MTLLYSTATPVLDLRAPSIIALAVYLDLDGVVADFDAGKRRLLGPNAPDLNTSSERLTVADRALKERLWALIEADPRFFRTLPLMPDAAELLAVIAPHRPTVLTAAPGFRGNRTAQAVAAGAKRAWSVSELQITESERFICTRSHLKATFINHQPGRVQLLIDDRGENCDAWTAVGGTAILHTSAASTIAAFQTLLREIDATAIPQ